MNSSQEPRRHHYVPIFYLKPWCRSDGRLAQFRCVGPTNRIFRKWVHPAETGYKIDLYKFRNIEPENQNWLEREFLGLVDTDGARARDALIAGEQLSPKLRDAWSRVIMSFIHRNPEKIEEIGNVWRKGYDDITRRLEPKYLSLRQKGDPETWEDYLVSQKKGTVERALANLIKGIIDSERIGTVLNNMQWLTLNFENSTKNLMTSDRPVVLPRGLAHDDSVVEIALSPKHLFVACNNPYRLEIALATDGEDRLMVFHNDAVAKQAKDYVWSVDHFNEKFVDNRLGKFSTQFIGWIPGKYTPPEGWDDPVTRVERKIKEKRRRR